MTLTPSEYILALARSFPCLRSKLLGWKQSGFDADLFHDMMRGWSTSERHAGLFILTVWNPHYACRKRWTFDLVEAVSSLDAVNREPIIEWMLNPFYP
jgi:hypothetical protein